MTDDLEKELIKIMKVPVRQNVYEYIWSKVFPDEEFNYGDFYDWSRENANIALELALQYCDLMTWKR